jgi:hypothetical protein
MITIEPLITKYALSALFGAATKTYLDYQTKKVSISELLVGLVANSIIAVGFGSISAYAFVGEFPSKDHFGYAIAFLTGAVGVNVIMGLLSVDWKAVIQRRLGK